MGKRTDRWIPEASEPKVLHRQHTGCFWDAFLAVGKSLGKFIHPKQQLTYEKVREQAKEVRDDRLPVSRDLLEDLLTATDMFLEGYNNKLAKAIFICAWTFAMRISEFSKTKVKGRKRNVSHNVRASSVRTSDYYVLSIAFESDKTTVYGSAVKHRTVAWSKLLPNTAR